MFKKFYALAMLVATILFSNIAYAQFNSGSNYNTANMSYQANSTISQDIVFDSNMQAGGTFDFSVNAHAGGGRPLQHDTANVMLEFFDSSGNLITSTQTSYSNNLLQMNAWSSAPGDNTEPWTTITHTYTLSATDAANTAYVKVTLIGTDSSWWAGNYGPQFQMPTLTFNGGTANILYNPEFGYDPTGIQAQGWTSSTSYSGVCGTTSGSATCVTNATGVTANMSGGGYSATGGTTSGTPGGYTSTLTSTTILATVNNGGTPPSGGGSPTVVSTAPGTPTVTSTQTTGATVTTSTSTYGTPTVTSVDSDAGTREGNTVTVTRTTTQTTTTPVTTVTTATTPVTTTTTSTPNTVTTWSNGTSTTAAGTPTTTTSTVNQVVTTTSTSNQVTTNVSTASDSASVAGMQDMIDAAIVNPFIVDPFNTPNGSWASPMFMTSSTSGSLTTKAVNFGHQMSGEGNILGFAAQAGNIESGNYNNALMNGTKYAGSVYVVSEVDPVLVRGSFGFSIIDFNSRIYMSSLNLENSTKAKQTLYFGDLAVYSSQEVYGVQPFVGATFITSTIDSIQESGSSLLSNPPEAGSKSYVNPYVGVRKTVADGVSIEVRTMQTAQYGNITGAKVIMKQKITDTVSFNVSAGYDQGTNYGNSYIMAGIVVKF